MTREHVPNRPSWDCFSCERPWPCDPAREELAQAYDPIGLAMFASERMIEAARDMPTTQPEELFERFFAWTRQIPRPVAGQQETASQPPNLGKW